MKTRPFLHAVSLAFALSLTASPTLAQVPVTEYEGETALGLDLRRLGTTKRVLMIGAHPDDERTEVLTALALGSGAEVAYLSLTRGEGGQNAIGPELQEGLGLIRSEELLSARRVDGARQYFGRQIDFGFSKVAEEAFRHWPHEEVLADVVATVRSFRPDVVIAVFSGTPADGHGQHQVSGIVAREGVVAAGDPRRFPEQIAAGLRPFTPARLYQSAGGYIGSGGPTAPATGPFGILDTGTPDPLFGLSHAQIAATSRSRHRSQGFGGQTAAAAAGPRSVTLRLARGDIMPPGAGLLAGVDTTFSARLASISPRGASAERALGLLRDYERAVTPLAASGASGDALVPALAAALRTLGAAQDALAGPAYADLRDRLSSERAEAEAALWRAQGLALHAVADDETVIPGQQLSLRLTLRNAGPRSLAIRTLEPLLPQGWRATALDPLPTRLAGGASLTRRFRVAVPADAPPTLPYFLRAPRTGDMYVWPAGVHVGIPFEPDAVRSLARVTIEGVTVHAEADATVAPAPSTAVAARPVRVVRPVSVKADPAIIAVPLGARPAGALAMTVRVLAEDTGPVSGELRLSAPAGWSATPSTVPARLAPGAERTFEIAVTPSGGLQPGEHRLAATYERSPAGRFVGGYDLIDYPHIRPQTLGRDAAVRVRAFDAQVPNGLRVGYVAGIGDGASQALRQLGVDVTDLTDQDLATADLSGFDAILLGIRAYEVRPDTVRAALVRNNARILEYVRNGGTLVSQYFRFENAPRDVQITPLPLTARLQERITDETVQVRLLAPDHPALSWPNRITAADFEGWAQERGLYYPREWGSEFTPLLEMADPGEASQRGGPLVAPYGSGTYVYTGLALFRQFPEGVPGAYRLLANLVSLGSRP